MKYYVVINEELEEYAWLLEHKDEEDVKGEYCSIVTNTLYELKDEDVAEITKKEYDYILDREAEEDRYLLEEREALIEKYI